jgi:hypothetical protein
VVYVFLPALSLYAELVAEMLVVVMPVVFLYVLVDVVFLLAPVVFEYVLAVDVVQLACELVAVLHNLFLHREVF